MDIARATGFVAPILAHRCRDGWDIVDGNHRVEALRRLGWNHVPVIEASVSSIETLSCRRDGSYSDALAGTPGPVAEPGGHAGSIRRVIW